MRIASDDRSSHRRSHRIGHVPGRRVLRYWRVGLGELDLEESMWWIILGVVLVVVAFIIWFFWDANI
jgi:hypothetical protein